jgi:hypothetical protein
LVMADTAPASSCTVVFSATNSSLAVVYSRIVRANMKIIAQG